MPSEKDLRKMIREAYYEGSQRKKYAIVVGVLVLFTVAALYTAYLFEKLPESIEIVAFKAPVVTNDEDAQLVTGDAARSLDSVVTSLDNIFGEGG